MTAKTDNTIPYDRQKVLSGDPVELDKALYEMVKSIEENQQKNAREINGDIRADYSEEGVKWTPILKDTVNSTTTFTYTHQVGFVMRKGLIVDAWFDILWSANVGAIIGKMYVELPYIATLSSQKPFVGVVQTSIFAYTAGTGCVINAVPNTRRGEIWNIGSAFPTARQDSVASGQILGHVRYIGQQNEW